MHLLILSICEHEVFHINAIFFSVTLQLIADQNPYVIGIRDTESVQVGHNKFTLF